MWDAQAAEWARHFHLVRYDRREYAVEVAVNSNGLRDPERAYAAAPNTVFSPSRLVSYAVHRRLHRGYYYSNTAYILAQMILEKATHDTYAHQLQKRIAKPLGLRSLSYRPTPYPRAVSDRMPRMRTFIAAPGSLFAASRARVASG